MKKLFKIAPIFIILYTGFQIYEIWDENQEKIEQLSSKIKSEGARKKRLQKSIKELKSYIADIDQAKAAVQQVVQEIEKIQRTLPENISDTENLTLIKSISDKFKIRNVSISPGGEDDQGFYIVKNYNLRARGTFLQFLFFFEKIAENERLLNINQMKMVISKEKQRGRFQLVEIEAKIQAYRYNPNYNEGTGLKGVNSKNKPRSKRKS